MKIIEDDYINFSFAEYNVAHIITQPFTLMMASAQIYRVTFSRWMVISLMVEHHLKTGKFNPKINSQQKKDLFCENLREQYVIRNDEKSKVYSVIIFNLRVVHTRKKLEIERKFFQVSRISVRNAIYCMGKIWRVFR